MRQWVANCYVLSVSILIAEYVRQHQEDARRGTSSSSSANGDEAEQEERVLAALSPAGSHLHPPPRTEQTVISKSSLNALALFLVDEIQHPMERHEDEADGACSLPFCSFVCVCVD